MSDGTDTRTSPLRARRSFASQLALFLMVQLVVFGLVVGLALLGDPFPISRVGVALEGSELVVVNAACPEERLRLVELVRLPDSASNGETLWRASGDAPLPESMAVGVAPSGLVTEVPLQEGLAEDEHVSLRVETSALPNPYGLDFRVGDVPADGVLSFDGEFPDRADFESSVLEATSCDDPDGQKLSPLMRLLGLGSIALTALGVAVYYWDRRRTRGLDPADTWPAPG